MKYLFNIIENNIKKLFLILLYIMIKRLFNKAGSGVKTLFNKGAGDAKQLFTKATKVANQANNAIDSGLNKASGVVRQVGNYANRAGNIVSGLSPLLYPEAMSAASMLQGVGSASKSATNLIKQGQQMKQNMIQAAKPAEMMQQEPAINFA